MIVEAGKEYELLLCFAQKIKFFIKDFLSTSDQIHRKLRIWPMLNRKLHFFCAVMAETCTFSAVENDYVKCLICNYESRKKLKIKKYCSIRIMDYCKTSR